MDVVTLGAALSIMKKMPDTAASSAAAAEDAADRAEEAQAAAEAAAEQAEGAIEVDDTLSVEGRAADAKVVGDEIGELKNALTGLDGIYETLPEEVIGTQDEPYTVEWEQGTVDPTGTKSNSNYRTRARIPIGGAIVGTLITSGLTAYWTRVFGANDTYLGSLSFDSNGDAQNDANACSNPCKIDTVLTLYPNATYVWLVDTWTSSADRIYPTDNNMSFASVETERKLNGVSLNSIYVRKDDAQKKPYSSSDILVQYDIDDTYYTKGRLKLPSNYMRMGTPVPLIVFVHGSADYSSIDAQMTNNYMAYYNYLRDCGYAVFDCFPWGSKYTEQTAGAANTWGLPINVKCYRSGIKYVLDEYNIDKNNIFVACKSLGGIQALSMYFDETIPVKAFGLLAPAMNPMNFNMGYSHLTKKVYASELEFSEDTEGVLNFDSNNPVPDGFRPYVMSNLDKWIGWNPYMVGLNILSADKGEYVWSDATTENLCRNSLGRPIKIWVAEDDGLITPCNALVRSLINGGYKAILRTLPANTGAHHATDTDPNALQKTNVTTKLGITYQTIPLAYYELGQWFDSNILK